MGTPSAEVVAQRIAAVSAARWLHWNDIAAVATLPMASVRSKTAMSPVGKEDEDVRFASEPEEQPLPCCG